MELTAIQQEIVTTQEKAVIVTAGAGSGKTRVLTHRIWWLIKQGCLNEEEILGLTFTNKAALQIRQRVEVLLGQTMNPFPAFLGTFHSWCARFLRKHIKSPWNKDFTIYDTKDSAKVYRQVGEENKEEYKKVLMNCNALDFEDLIEKTLEILEEDNDIRTLYQNKIKYILVDEFQDTDFTQYKIVKILAEKQRQIMVVGDEDQCIYSWRGANIENLNLFLNDFKPKIFKLEQNFRSSKNIVELANKLVQHNLNRLDKHLFSELPRGEIKHNTFYDERNEAQMIAMQIMNEHRMHGTPYSHFAILMRLNATSRNFEEQFRGFGIPHIIWGGFKFYERAEIKSTINYLRVLCNPRDEVAYYDAMCFPKRGVGDSSIEKLKKGESIPKKAQAGVDEFKKVLNELETINKKFGLVGLATSLISTIGLDIWFSGEKEDDISRLENIYELVEAIKNFAKDNPGATLNDFLQQVSLVQDTDNGENGDAVIISTIHSAKGLEFENVFLIALESGIFPLYRATQRNAELEEERRLLYVGITRAMKNLYLSNVQSRFFMGDRKYQNPSEFLYDCDLIKSRAPTRERFEYFD